MGFIERVTFFLIFFNFYLFYFILFLAVLGLLLLHTRFSLVAASRGHSLLQCAGFSLRWLLLLRSMGSRCMGLSSCGTQAQSLWLVGSRVQALRHVGSSQTRARTHVPCIGRQILSHCATRKALNFLF